MHKQLRISIGSAIVALVLIVPTASASTEAGDPERSERIQEDRRKRHRDRGRGDQLLPTRIPVTEGDSVGLYGPAETLFCDKEAGANDLDQDGASNDTEASVEAAGEVREDE
jgi:hypothetical protein